MTGIVARLIVLPGMFASVETEFATALAAMAEVPKVDVRLLTHSLPIWNMPFSRPDGMPMDKICMMGLRRGRRSAKQVDQILTVLPEETEHLAIEPGRDLVTLITCTPYGVNSHRLLVRGTRVEYIPEDMQQVMQEQAPENWFESLPIQFRHGLTGAAVILMVVLLRWLVLLFAKFLKRRKQS